jgi:hypothetical protein
MREKSEDGRTAMVMYGKLLEVDWLVGIINNNDDE